MSKSKKMPHIPPDQRSTKGTGSDPDVAKRAETDSRRENTDQQGDQANVRQNTRNQGYQQDR